MMYQLQDPAGAVLAESDRLPVLTRQIRKLLDERPDLAALEIPTPQGVRVYHRDRMPPTDTDARRIPWYRIRAECGHEANLYSQYRPGGCRECRGETLRAEYEAMARTALLSTPIPLDAMVPLAELFEHWPDIQAQAPKYSAAWYLTEPRGKLRSRLGTYRAAQHGRIPSQILHPEEVHPLSRIAVRVRDLCTWCLAWGAIYPAEGVR